MDKEDKRVVILNEIIEDPDKIFGNNEKMKEVVKDPLAVIELLKQKDSYHEVVTVDGEEIKLYRPLEPHKPPTDFNERKNPYLRKSYNR